MKNDRQHQNRGAVSGWEDDGGARDADRRRGTDHAGLATGTHQSEQQVLDASHDSDARGEHRYDDLHQTASEQGARRERDQLKQRLAAPRGRAR
jgi:hypothetical protein